MDRREEKFIKYNRDNIFMNLLQIEQHLRDINSEDLLLGHAQCCNKHALMIQGELDEAISHASVVEPEREIVYRQLKDAIIEFRQGMSHRTSKQNIRSIRDFRKIVERLDPVAYDTRECRACRVKPAKEGLAVVPVKMAVVELEEEPLVIEIPEKPEEVPSGKEDITIEPEDFLNPLFPFIATGKFVQDIKKAVHHG